MSHLEFVGFIRAKSLHCAGMLSVNVLRLFGAGDAHVLHTVLSNININEI